MTAASTAEWLIGRDNFIILTHKKPDGDTLCSAAALASALRRVGKTAYLLPNEEATERYLDHMAEFFAPDGYEGESVIAVDASDTGRFPKNAASLSSRTDLCIDHHVSNSDFASISLVMPERAACGEIVFDIIKALCGGITPKEAELLYIALTTDTGCLAYGNTTADTISAVAELVRAGADNAFLNKKFFRTKSKSRIALEGMIFSSLRFYHDGKTCVATVTLDMLAKCGAVENDLDDIANIPGLVEGVVSGVVVRENPDGSSKISLRTLKSVDANAVCASFGGGGHPMASGCTICAPVDKAAALIVEEIGKAYG